MAVYLGYAAPGGHALIDRELYLPRSWVDVQTGAAPPESRLGWSSRPSLVHVAGRRWTIEEKFQATRTLTGLDEHQVRCWASWHRWVTLSMVAAAFLTVAAAAERHRNLTPPGQIPLTPNDHRLFSALALQPAHSCSHWLAWSHWRRRHQHRAMQCTISTKLPETHKDKNLWPEDEEQAGLDRDACRPRQFPVPGGTVPSRSQAMVSVISLSRSPGMWPPCWLTRVTAVGMFAASHAPWADGTSTWSGRT